MATPLSRRDFMARAGVVGCSLAASPLLTPVSLAAAPWDTRFVFIILRGGLDGLDAVQPYGDTALRTLRPGLSVGPEGGAIDLDGRFALHPALADLMPLWRAGQLSFVHAVSTPYRNKRSHFDGQDLLEAGTNTMAGVRDGWLNRMLQIVPGVTSETAYAIGRTDMLLMRGAAEVANWSPDVDLNLSPQAIRLLELVTEQDPAIHAALAEAQLLAERTKMDAAGDRAGHIEIAHFAAARLSEEARIAAFSLNGWDTHRNQDVQLGRALTRLSETLLALRAKMRGGTWGKTAVVVMTEFGRTARQNGTKGTDHGTGGVMILAGGAIKGGQVFGTWPGVGEGQLYENRDLLPDRKSVV